MTPRNTKQGASASARKAPAPRRARDASPQRSATTAAARPKARPRPKADAHPKANSKPKTAGAKASARPKRDASWFRWWLLPIFVVAAVGLFIFTYYPVARVQYLETRRRAQLRAELGALQTRNDKLSTQVARLKTPEGVEDYARSQLGMVKQGEHVVVVTDGKPVAVVASATAGGPPTIDTSGETTIAPAGPWGAFLDSVFKVQ